MHKVKKRVENWERALSLFFFLRHTRTLFDRTSFYTLATKDLSHDLSFCLVLVFSFFFFFFYNQLVHLLLLFAHRIFSAKPHLSMCYIRTNTFLLPRTVRASRRNERGKKRAREKKNCARVFFN